MIHAKGEEWAWIRMARRTEIVSRLEGLNLLLCPAKWIFSDFEHPAPELQCSLCLKHVSQFAGDFFSRSEGL